MAIYIIGDLHLSFSTNKPMDVFGKHWLNHHLHIARDWRARVTADDLVILAGDTSWAISLDEAQADFNWIAALPGSKLVLKGNHDYWWSTLAKMQVLGDDIDFLHNNSYTKNAVSIVGTRGWDVPNELNKPSQDLKVYRRECQRLQLSIDSAPANTEKICVLHYPPFDERGRTSDMIDIIERAGIKRVYFGHIHSNYRHVRQGAINGVDYRLISCDYLGFQLYKVLD